MRTLIPFLMVVLSGCASVDPEESCRSRIADRLARVHPEVSEKGVQVVCTDDLASRIATLPDGSMCVCVVGLYDSETQTIYVTPGGSPSMKEDEILDHEAGHAFWDLVMTDGEKYAWMLEYYTRKAEDGPWPSERSKAGVLEYHAESYRISVSRR